MGQPEQRSVEGLAVKVDLLETSVGEIKDSLLGLDTKIDKAVADLAREVRSALSGLSTQLTERQRTPWTAIGSVGAVIVALCIYGASQLLSPIQQDVKRLQADIVPRVELDNRMATENRQFDELRRIVGVVDDRRYQEQRDLIGSLREEIRRLQPK